MRFLARLALAAGIILTLGAFAGHAQNISDAQRGDIEKIIREYLIAHPEVLQEAMAELEKKQAADEAAKNLAAVKDNAETIFNSTRQVVAGNPQGDVTFVEFFDYNCGYCKRAMDDMFALMTSELSSGDRTRRGDIAKLDETRLPLEGATRGEMQLSITVDSKAP